MEEMFRWVQPLWKRAREKLAQRRGKTPVTTVTPPPPEGPPRRLQPLECQPDCFQTLHCIKQGNTATGQDTFINYAVFLFLHLGFSCSTNINLGNTTCKTAKPPENFSRRYSSFSLS
jgi:hypothetical protein